MSVWPVSPRSAIHCDVHCAFPPHTSLPQTATPPNLPHRSLLRASTNAFPHYWEMTLLLHSRSILKINPLISFERMVEEACLCAVHAEGSVLKLCNRQSNPSCIHTSESIPQQLKVSCEGLPVLHLPPSPPQILIPLSHLPRMPLMSPSENSMPAKRFPHHLKLAFPIPMLLAQPDIINSSYLPLPH